MKGLNNRIKILFITFCSLTIFTTSCNKEQGKNINEEEEAIISLSVRAAANSINTDQVLWEDRVDELRMLIFDPNSGDIVFNQKLYFPNGFDEASRAVRLTPGTYNFYFIANETVYDGAFVTALMNIQNVSEFTSNTIFTTLAYNPDFIPDATSANGRFIMSAIYNNVTVSGGGTETNPAPLIVSTGRVELIRALAKVEVIFWKKVVGSNVPENTITSVLLEQVASTLSIPPLDNYYTGPQTDSPQGTLTGLDYSRDSIGAVTFYIPEFLVPEGNTNYTILEINNQAYPIQTDAEKTGITLQRRTVPTLSNNSVIRNYHYIINAYIDAAGGLQLQTYVQPWSQDSYYYIFQGDHQITIPPVIPTDSSIIITTDCGKIEILNHNEQLSQGLQGAYHDQVIYYDPETQGPIIIRGDPPYYCEQKYGEGWRLINSCELMSFLALFDEVYTIWLSNTWLAADHNVTYYPLRFRQAAQTVLQTVTGIDLSGSVLYPTNNFEDDITDTKLDIIDRFLTPGDIMIRIQDFPGGWPYAAPPGTDLEWFYNQASIQVKAFWYDSGYIPYRDRDNWDEILYGEFERYDYSSTVSRCVRTVE